MPRGQVKPPLFKQTTITFNPWDENHWLKRRFFDTPRADTLAMTTNYTCNEFLDATDRALYTDMQKRQPRRYAVAGLGQWGKAEGLIFDNWRVEAFDPAALKGEAFRHIFGLDYGYTNDPTAFIAAAAEEAQMRLYIYDEHYACKMLNADIARMLTEKGYKKERIRADSAEPKSNEDLRRLGITRLKPAQKGRDSVNAGIARLQEYTILVHPSCVHTAAELAAYAWEPQTGGAAGVFSNRPQDTQNHLMDALQKIPISSHPRECLTATVGAPGNEIRRNLRAIPHSGYHISHRLYRIPSVIGTAGGTLEETVIPLDLCHLLLRVEFDKLGILVGGEDEEVLAFQQSV